MTRARDLILRTFDIFGLIMEAPFKVAELLIVPILGMILVGYGGFLVLHTYWLGLILLLVGTSFIASPLIRKKNK